MVNINKIKKGDFLYEQSHYVVLDDAKQDKVALCHLESETSITISKSYIQNLLTSGDHYTKEVKVTKEDKKDGTLGIRSIWQNIYDQKPFTVCFKKQDSKKTVKSYNEEIDKQVQDALALIDKAKKNKKSMSDAYKEAVKFIQANPIKDTIEGEMRVLRGYKIQFSSNDGKYDVIDIDLPNDDKSNQIRQVNVNNISYLILDDIKYVVA